jgi:hypothetical protein
MHRHGSQQLTLDTHDVDVGYIEQSRGRPYNSVQYRLGFDWRTGDNPQDFRGRFLLLQRLVQLLLEPRYCFGGIAGARRAACLCRIAACRSLLVLRFKSRLLFWAVSLPPPKLRRGHSINPWWYSEGPPTDVRFGSKADRCSAKRHVRFAPESGHHEGKTGHIKRSTGRRSGALNISASQTHCLFEYVADRVRGWRARRVITGAALN